MGFLQWLTIGFTAFLFLLVLTYWMGWSRPGTGPDYRKDMFAALMGIEGLLIGAFVQEQRVQEKEAQVAQAQQVADDYSARARQIQRLAERVVTQQPPATPQTKLVADSIRIVVGELKRVDSVRQVFRRPGLLPKRP